MVGPNPYLIAKIAFNALVGLSTNPNPSHKINSQLTSMLSNIGKLIEKCLGENEMKVAYMYVRK